MGGIKNMALWQCRTDFLFSLLLIFPFGTCTVLGSTDLHLQPFWGPEFGGTNITLTVDEPFDCNVNRTCCYFGSDLAVEAHPVNDSNSFWCVSPPFMPWTVDVQIKDCFNSRCTISKSSSFTYTAALSITSLNPTHGPVNGLTPILVKGTNFLNTTKLACSFEDIIVKASFVSSTELHCKSPESGREGVVLVKVSNNGIDFEASYTSFVYTSVPVIFSVVPVSLVNYKPDLFIEGRGFSKAVHSSIPLCRAGNITGYGIVHNDTALTCNFSDITSHNAVEKNRIELSFNGINWISSNAMITSYPRPIIKQLNPGTVFESSEMILSLTGNHFYQFSKLFCFFKEGMPQTPLVVHTWSAATCKLPDSPPGDYQIHLTDSGNLWSSKPTTFTIKEAVTVSSITPNFGSWFGGTLLELIGTGFDGLKNESLVMCDFGIHGKTSLTVSGIDTASCIVPHALIKESSKTTLSVSVKDRIIFSFPSPYRYVPSPRITSFKPDAGTSSGGTTIYISGEYFGYDMVDLSAAACKFGSVITSAQILTHTLMSCISPRYKLSASEAIHKIALSVSLNGADFVTSQTSFTFYPSPKVDKVIPLTGSVRGGTVVSISGETFHEISSSHCLFGTKKMRATFRSPNLLTCKTPTLTDHEFGESGLVEISLSPNGVDYESSSYFFQYFPDVVIHEHFPVRGSIEGGTKVFLMGGSFNFTTNIHCKFGDGGMMIPAKIESTSLISCISPSMGTPVTVGLFLSFNDGHDFIESPSKFSFVKLMKVLEVKPRLLSYVGGEIISIVGENLNAENILCDVGEVRVNVTVLSDSLVQFVSPTFSGEHNVTVKISPIGGSYLEEMSEVLEIIYPPCIHDVYPPFSPETGGTFVKLSVEEDKIESCDKCFCVFYQYGRSKTTPVVVSSLGIQCEVPAWQYGTGTVFLSLTWGPHGGDLHNCRKKFEILQAMKINSAHPQIGSVAGGTLIAIKGNGFQSIIKNYKCMFEAPGHRHFSTDAFLHGDDLLFCQSPSVPFNLSGTASLYVGVQYENNIHRLTDDDSIEFTFFSEENTTIQVLRPVTGPSTGGTNIFLDGISLPFDVNISCQFEIGRHNLTVPAVRLTRESLSCTTPNVQSIMKSNIMTAKFYLSSDDFYLTPQKDLFFHFHEQLFVSDISPSCVVEGSRIALNVHGRNFFPYNKFYCRFEPVFSTDDDIVTAQGRLISNTNAHCTQPPLKVGEYTVRVSKNGLDFSSTSATFTVHSPISSFHLEPSYGIHGGSFNVSLRGSGFVNSCELSCQFGSHIMPAYFINSTQIFCTIPTNVDHNSKYVDVTISVNSIEFQNSYSTEFLYVKPFILSSIVPPTISESGGAQVFVLGDFPDFDDNINCNFAAKRVPALMISRSMITCLAPEITNRKFVSLSISNRFGNLLSSSPLYVYIENVPKIRNIKPSKGREGGGYQITVSGSGFIRTPELACKFGTIAVKAEYLSPNTLLCNAPQSKVGKVRFQISFNGLDWTLAEGGFEFLKSGNILRVSPHSVPINFGGKLHIYTQDIDDWYSNVLCAFNGTMMRASIISSHMLSCGIPSDLFPGHYVVDVLDEFYNSMISYGQKGIVDLIHKVTFERISPSFGSIQGGTLIEVVGSGFTENIDCLFESSEWRATAQLTFINSTTSICKAPSITHKISDESSLPIKYFLRFVWNSFVSKSTFFFQYNSDIVIERVMPLTGSRSGGTLINIYSNPKGRSWKLSPNLACRFGSYMSKAYLLSPTVLECKAPRIDSEGITSTDISVTENGVDYITPSIEYYKWFTYSDVANVFSVQPRFGPVTGGLLIELNGQGYFNSSTLSCIFSNTENSSSIVTTATFISDTLLTCLTPSMEGPGIINIFASNNGFEIGSSTTYSVIPDSRITNFVPNFGFKGIDTQITLTGSFFRSENNDPEFNYYCSLDEVYMSEAYFVNNHSLVCITKCFKEGNMQKLTLVMGDMKLLSTSTRFHCERLPIVEKISPSRVTEDESAILTLTGKHLKNRAHVQCLFKLDGESITGNQTFINESKVQCEFPGFSKHGIASVFLRNKGMSFIPLDPSLGIKVIPKMTISHVEPRKVPIGGLVTITGTNFDASSQPSCKIGDEIGTVLVRSSTRITCQMSQKNSINDYVGVSLSWNNISYANTERDKFIRIIPSPIIREIVPKADVTTGGSILTIQGENFIISHYECIFDNSPTDAIYISESLLFCTIPPAHTTKLAKVELYSRIHGHFHRMSFQYYNMLRVHSINPQLGSFVGGTPLTIFTDQLNVEQTYECNFGDIRMPAIISSDISLSCITPSVSHPKEVTFSLSLMPSQVQVSDRLLSYKFIDIPSLDRIEPCYGPLQGMTLVNLYGKDFPTTQEYSLAWCKFGHNLIFATRVDNNTVSCFSPSSSNEGKVQVSISFNGKDFTNSASFLYTTKLAFNEIIPPNGPISGGTLIKVRGLGFSTSQNLQCHFGRNFTQDTNISATIVYDGIILCRSPPAEKEGPMRLFVKDLSNSIIADTGFDFFFEKDLNINKVSWKELNNDVDLKRDIKVFGDGFSGSKNIYCRWSFGKYNDEYAIGNIISPSILTCPMFIHPSNFLYSTPELVLSLTTNKVDFVYAPETLINKSFNQMVKIIPPFVSSTQELVEIHAPNIFSKQDYICWFGKNAVPGIYVSQNSIFCHFNAFQDGSNDLTDNITSTIVSISAEKFPNDILLGPIDFHYYYDNLRIELFPYIGPYSGKTVVSIKGLEHVISELSERRINFTPSVSFGEVSVFVIVENGTLICTSPSYSETFSHTSRVQVSISLNGLSNNNCKTCSTIFQYVPDSILIEAVPTIAFLNATKYITVLGENFLPTLTCLFGPYHTPANFRNEFRVDCPIPEQINEENFQKGHLSLALSLNGQDVSKNIVTIKILPLPIISKINVTSGDENNNCQTISLFGRNLFSEVVLFQKKYVLDGAPAQYENETNLICEEGHCKATICLEGISNVYDGDNSIFIYGHKFELPPIEINIVTNDLFEADPIYYDTPLVRPNAWFENFEKEIEVVEANISSKITRFFCVFIPEKGAVQHTIGEWNKQEKIVCKTPKISAGYVKFYIADIEGNKKSGAAELQVHPISIITEARPSNSLFMGGTVVRIFGGNFMETPFLIDGFSYYCSFDSEVVYASVINDSLLTCESPPIMENANTTKFEVALNILYGDILKENTVTLNPKPLRFLYRSIGVNSVNPKIINFSEISSVRLSCFGIEDGDQLFVRIQSASNPRIFDTVNVTKIDNSEVDVFIPPKVSSGLGKSYIQLSVNGQTFSSEKVSIIFMDALKSVLVYPPKIPELSSTYVSIYFQQRVDVFNHILTVCKFDDFTTPASKVDKYGVNCLSPTTLRPGFHNLSLVTDSHVSLWSGSIYVRKAVEVHSAHPVHGPSYGNTPVIVSGKGFWEVASSLECSFGGKHFTPKILSDNRLECISPSLRTISESKKNLVNSYSLRLHLMEEIETRGQTKDLLDIGLYFTYSQLSFSDAEPKLLYGSGETQIWIKGSNFQHENISCKVGLDNQRDVDYVNETHILVEAPPASIAFGSYRSFLDHLGAENFAEARLVILFRKQEIFFQSVKYILDPTLYEVSPRYGSYSGGTQVRVEGENFPRLGTDPLCMFGSTIVIGKVLSTKELLCTSPPQKRKSIKDYFGISFNGFDFISHSKIYFQYKESPSISSIFPEYGPSLGRNFIIVNGTNFGLNMWCSFNNIRVRASFISKSQMSCVAPSSLPGDVHFQVEENDSNITSNKIIYSYLPEVIITGLTPAFGSINGGTCLTMSGLKFPKIPELFCTFNNTIETPVSWISDKEIECLTPPFASLGEVTLSIVVANEKTLLSSSPINFLFTAAPKVNSVNPPFAWKDGGNLVSVTGSNFLFPQAPRNPKNILEDASCNFEVSGKTSASILSDELLTCLVPPSMTEGEQSISISLNGKDYFGKLMFTYVENPVILNMSPSHGSIRGGTNVTVRLSRNLESKKLLCIFAKIEVLARVNSDRTISCISPAYNATKVNFAIKFYHGNLGSSLKSSSQVFHFISDARITEVHPYFISTKFYSGTFEVSGLNFFDSPQLKCKYSYSFADDSSAQFMSGVQFINSTFITCIERPICGVQFSMYDITSLRLQVSSNDHDWSSPAEILLVPEHRVYSVFPRSGPLFGGTLLTVSGTNFLKSKMAKCRFGGLPETPATFQSSEYLTCRTPETIFLNDSSSVDVTVTLNGVDFSTQYVPFTFFSSYSVKAVSPLFGPSTGGTNVLVDLMVHPGQEIPSPLHEGSHGALCKFGNVIVHGHIVNSSTVSCLSPAHDASGGFADVEISFNAGGDWSGNRFKFLYSPGQQREKVTLRPSHGPSKGGTTVEIHGLAGIFPLWNENLTVNASYALCKFDDISFPVASISKDGNVVQCVSPSIPRNIAGNETFSVNVEISYNGAPDSFVSLHTYFTYDPDIAVSKVSPDVGPRTGGTWIYITGGPFPILHENIYCRFDKKEVLAIWINSFKIKCRTPASSEFSQSHNVGEIGVHVEVSVNGGYDYSRNDEVLFHYVNVMSVNKIIPSHGSIQGGTNIVVHGSDFFFSSKLMCHFSLLQQKPVTYSSRISRYINETCIICTSPPSEYTGDAFVTVSLSQEVDYTDEFYEHQGINLTNRFTYQDIVRINSFFPGLGPKTGNTVINVYGGLFLEPFFNPLCRFGHDIVHAHVENFNVLRCQSPPGEIGSSKLGISLNGVDFVFSEKDFFYHEDIVLDSIEPRTGPAISAGTKLSIFGSGFRNTTGLRCKFDEFNVPGIFVSSHHIICYSPPANTSDLDWFSLNRFFSDAHTYPNYLAKISKIDVTNNYFDYTSDGALFLYQADIRISNVYNEKGPLSGKSPIFITGSGFVNSSTLACRIGHRVIDALFLTQECILCFAPSHHDISNDEYRGYNSSDFVTNELHDQVHILHVTEPGLLKFRYFVEVSNNGIDFSGDGFFYSYLKSAEGYYFPENDNVELPCPVGSYCDNDVKGNNFTLCPRGTYQSSSAQTDCVPCPIGYFCPDEGLPVPRLCPAGYVCDVSGIGVIQQPCPEGHFCLEGTATTGTYCNKRNLYTRNAKHLGFALGGRNSACWNNSTDDFGLQVSNIPAIIWSELHTMPLDVQSDFVPIRGRYCLDDSCLRIEDDFGFSANYESSNVALRRPIPCPKGFFCHPGTIGNATIFNRLSTPQPCLESMYCPEGSDNPSGEGDCPVGFYCPFSRKIPCPVGTYCPQTYHTEPLLCTPGTFNGMVSQTNCTICPVGYFCGEFGMVEPKICPAGYVCSAYGLVSPNLLCPPGFYCNNGTQTSDPFRNDTTLRPYPCSPGTYCLSGTGFIDVVEGNFLYAQHCHKGYFCESASTSPKGAGLCPAGFTCPIGTATPIPTAKGTYAEFQGTVEAASCLPGFYTPTIESTKCYPCPPGTTCENEKTALPTSCPPGTFRSTLEENGLLCTPCPQGTWSRSWELHERGECIRCPPGIICPVDGMTNPCSRKDLPTSYEPVVNLNGLPVPEYFYPAADKPPSFSSHECLKMNSEYKEGEHSIENQEFFFGELIPPYIDVLGRGAHFRPSDEVSLKYSSTAKCFRNFQPYGSEIYQRLSNYHGPQFDIQSGNFHEEYLNDDNESLHDPSFFRNSRKLHHSFDRNFTGSLDLPVARKFTTDYNCTAGIQLMNETLIFNQRKLVYTDPNFDTNGGYDVEKCPVFDNTLDCYIDPYYEAHREGECCHIKRFQQRAILQASDQWYPGTCEADIICSSGLPSKAMPCKDGFICDQSTTLDKSISTRCREGYFCNLGTTPDPSLDSPQGQFKHLCPSGLVCSDASSIETQERCPENHFCPTGTANPILGKLASDELNRGIDTMTNPTNSFIRHLHISASKNFFSLDNYGANCINGEDKDLSGRVALSWKEAGEDVLNPYLLYLLNYTDRDKDGILDKPYDSITTPPLRPKQTNENILYRESCGRDAKRILMKEGLERNACDCITQLYVVIAVYRLWKCTSTLPLEDFGVGSLNDVKVGRGDRDFWFQRIHRDFHLAVSVNSTLPEHGLQWGDGKVCEWPENGILSPIRGKIPHFNEETRSVKPLPGPSIPETSGGFVSFIDKGTSEHPIVNFTIQFKQDEVASFDNYEQLKDKVEQEFKKQQSGIVDPYIFDLHTAILLVEEYGDRLKDISRFREVNAFDSESTTLTISESSSSNISLTPYRLDSCECQRLLKCPNGTFSPEKSTSIEDCISYGNEVLERVLLSPAEENATHQQIELHSLEVAILSIDNRFISNNLTYNDHYKFSIYEDCLPCPNRYKCENDVQRSFCSSPTLDEQYENLNQCLIMNKIQVCVRSDGTEMDVSACTQSENIKKGRLSSLSKTKSYGDASFEDDFLLFEKPDLKKCQSMPLFCEDKVWDNYEFRLLCQDDLGEGEKSAIYDCRLVEQYNRYQSWRDHLCCTSADFINKNLCLFEKCIDIIKADRLIRDHYSEEFFSEFGYGPPSFHPKGELLMDPTLQAGSEHPKPFDLFYAKSKENSQETNGCCRCQSHTLPEYFQSERKDIGFPDNKHQVIQMTITALNNVRLLIFAELLHGQYYKEFRQSFSSQNNTEFRIHTPSRAFVQSSTPSQVRYSWLSIIQKEDHTELELPLNLPIKWNHNHEKEYERRILIDRPSEVNIGSRLNRKDFVGSKISDDGIIMTQPYQDRETFTNLRETESWWSENSADMIGAKATESTFIALPYFPFFSNCAGYDSHISISRLLEDNPACTLIDYENTVSVGAFGFIGSSKPTGDVCQEEINGGNTVSGITSTKGIDLKCLYEEDIESSSEKVRWYEASAGSTLFYLTKDPQISSDFEGSFVVNEEDGNLSILSLWGQTKELAGLQGSDKVIPVTVDDVKSGVINAIPRSVKLELQYYQVSKGKKRLVQGVLFYDDLCTTLKPEEVGGNKVKLRAMKEQGIFPCALDASSRLESYEYIFEVHFFPLSWFHLFNQFQFYNSLYVIFFFIVGLLSIAIPGFIWLSHRLLTKMQRLPIFRFLSLLKLLSIPAMKGCLLGACPLLLGGILIYSWLGCYKPSRYLSTSALDNPNTFALESINGSWLNTAALDVDRVESYRIGRLGLALVCLGFYCSSACAQTLTEDKAKTLEHIDKSQNISMKSALYMKQTHFLWICLTFTVPIVCIWEYSFSPNFEGSVYLSILMLRVLQIFMSIIIDEYLKEHLTSIPFIVLTRISEVLITMGASTFVDFTITHFVILTMMVIERMYVSPLTAYVKRYLPKWKLLLQKQLNQRTVHSQLEKRENELKWIAVKEFIETKSEGIEQLVDSYGGETAEIIAFQLVPIINMLFILFYNQIDIPSKYGIERAEMTYFTLFSFLIIPWKMISSVIIVNTQELRYGWHLFDYISYQHYRFVTRQNRFLFDSVPDESITPRNQSIDKLCFSEQYYFIVSLCTLSMMYQMLGLSIFLHTGYSPMSDPLAPIVLSIAFVFCKVFHRVLNRLSRSGISYLNWSGLWVITETESTLDEKLAEKMAVGQGRQADLEKEKMELEALNSEKFRRKFLNRNRVWLMQNLEDILTPQALRSLNKQGDRVEDYIRDIYAHLLKMGQGAKRPGDRSDISSDDDDDLNEIHRKWARIPLKGANLEIAKRWLERARKRRLYFRQVKGVIEKHSRSTCQVCSAKKSNALSLVTGLSLNNKFCPRMLDLHIESFEKKYPDKKQTPELWIAHFQRNAEFVTYCMKCLQDSDIGKTGGFVPNPSAEPIRITRDVDISSDEDEESNFESFEPLFIEPETNEFNIIFKWLNAAKVRMGKEAANVLSQNHARKSIATEILSKEESVTTRLKRTEVEQNGASIMNETTRNIATAWMQQAKVFSKDRNKKLKSSLIENITVALSKMRREDDWFVGQEFRKRGEALLTEIELFENNRLNNNLEGVSMYKVWHSQASSWLKSAESKIKSLHQMNSSNT